MKHYVALIVILCVAAGGHWGIRAAQARRSANATGQRVRAIPSSIGEYQQRGADHTIDEHTQLVLETSTILIRDYIAPPKPQVQLTIVYAGATRRSLHFPEVCLVGGGWEIREQRTHPVAFLFSAKRLVLVNGAQKQAVLYWFKTGDTLTGNFFLNAYYWAKNQVTGGGRTSAMIKLTAMVRKNQNEDAVFAALEDFAVMLTPMLSDYVP